MTLGSFATAEEAALCIARSPAVAESQSTFPAVPPGVSLKEEDTVPPMPPSSFVKEEGAVPHMPPVDAFVKVEVGVKVKEGSADGRPLKGSGRSEFNRLLIRSHTLIISCFHPSTRTCTGNSQNSNNCSWSGGRGQFCRYERGQL